jgi:hypothetical protein
MKRLMVVAISIFLLFSGGLLFGQNEEEVTYNPQVLIDFSNLDNTEVDFSNFPGAMAEGVDEIILDLSLRNWGVDLAPSSDTPMNSLLSETKAVNSNQMQGEVLGVRVHFPTAPFNSWAQVRPPFEIPFYADAEGDQEGEGTQFVNKGVLRNVGTIRSISLRVTGRNFPHGLSLSLKNEQNREREMFMGYLDFDGWRTLTWENPNYITDVKHRDLRKKPLYPETMPSMKFDTFTIYRNGSNIGGDFVTYFKDVVMVYDLAILETERDINDEEVWGILKDRRDAKRAAEMRRLGILQLLRKQERIKMQHALRPEEMENM